MKQRRGRVTPSPLPFSGPCATRPARLILWSPRVFQKVTHPREPPGGGTHRGFWETLQDHRAQVDGVGPGPGQGGNPGGGRPGQGGTVSPSFRRAQLQPLGPGLQPGPPFLRGSFWPLAGARGPTPGRAVRAEQRIPWPAVCLCLALSAPPALRPEDPDWPPRSRWNQGRLGGLSCWHRDCPERAPRHGCLRGAK